MASRPKWQAGPGQKVVARALNALAEVAAEVCHEAHQGFIAGRSMLDDDITAELEAASMLGARFPTLPCLTLSVRFPQPHGHRCRTCSLRWACPFGFRTLSLRCRAAQHA